MDLGPRPAPAPIRKGRLLFGLLMASPLYALAAFLAFVFFQRPEDVPLETRAKGLRAPAVELFAAARGGRSAGRVGTGAGIPRPIPAVYRQLTPFDDPIELAAVRHGVPSNLVRAVVHVESAFNPRAVSRVGAQGLMQLMPGTARDMNVIRSFDPLQNIDGGTKYLSVLSRQFGGDLVRIIAAYNAGPEAVRRYGGVPPFEETQGYVRRVLEFYDQYNAANPAGAGADVALIWPLDGPLSEAPADPLRTVLELPPTGGWVRAVSDGLVVATVRETGGTWRVRVQHDGRFSTVYQGLVELNTALGRSVESGTRLGRLNSRTGALRFQVLEADRPRDPLEFRWARYREPR